MFNFIKQFQKSILIGAIVLILAVGVIWWIYGLFHVSTDDAYVNANIIQISPRVSGQVNGLSIVNNQYVKKGDVLFTLDPAMYSATLQHDQSAILVADAKQSIAQITADRTLALVKQRAASKQEGDIALANLKSAIAERAITVATETMAQLNLQYTRITAPSDGWVTNVTLRIGNLVTANMPLFALISDGYFWVDANFRETDINRIKAGQKADVVVDMYPNHHFHGVVESIQGGSGTAFSLLPPENATGNWVKVTQRVPVRIRILNPDAKFPLRIGTSATVTINT